MKKCDKVLFFLKNSKLLMIPFVLFCVLLCTACHDAPVSADTESVRITDTAAVVTVAVEDTAVETEAVPETDTQPIPADTVPAPVESTDTEISQQTPDITMLPPAQVHLTFVGVPNRYEYMPCAVTVTDPSGAFAEIYDEQSQIKVRGHSTSSGEKQPYNIKFQKKTDLLGLGNSKKWNLLANLYDRTQLRNMLALQFAQDIGLSNTSKTCFAEVYVNDTYRGLYQIAEPIDVGPTALDLNTEANDFILELEPYSGYENFYCLTTPRFEFLLGCSEPEKPGGSQWNWLVTFMTGAEDALLSGDWKQVEKFFNVESFARCYIVQELFKNVDYCVSSTRFYIKDGILYEGPVWDFDLSSGNCSKYEYPDYNNVKTTGHSYEGQYCVGLYNAHLFAYEEFRVLVSRLYKELQPIIVNLYQDNEKGSSRIDAYLDCYGEALDRNASLWSPDTTYSHLERDPVDGTYDAEITYLRDWLRLRNEWLYGVLCTAE